MTRMKFLLCAALLLFAAPLLIQGVRKFECPLLIMNEEIHLCIKLVSNWSRLKDEENKVVSFADSFL